MGDILGLADPPERVHALQFIEACRKLFPVAQRRTRRDRARADHVRANVELRVIRRHQPHHRDEATFCGGVCGLADGAQRIDARDGNNAPSTALLQKRNGMLRAQEGALEAGGQRSVPVSLFQRGDLSVVEGGERIVDQNVQPAEFRSDALHHVHHLGFGGVVG